jgi:aminoglycoside 3-N-acetyltransferase
MTEVPAVTVDSLVADLRRLGLAEGDAVVMRCATRAIAPGAKGLASVLLDALLQTVGPGGTVIGPTHAALQKASEKEQRLAVFSDDAPTTAGGFGAAMLRHPGRVRSAHPHNSVAAIGAQAHFLLDAHDEHALPFSWMRRMLEISGKELVIGCVTDNPGINTVHWTQEELGLSGGSFLAGKEGNFVAVPGEEPHWVPRTYIPGCSLGFYKMYGHYVRAGILRGGFIGEAYSIMLNAAESVLVDRAIMTKDPRAVLCDNAWCVSCASWSYSRRRLPALASSTLLLKAKAARDELARRRSDSARASA